MTSKSAAAGDAISSSPGGALRPVSPNHFEVRLPRPPLQQQLQQQPQQEASDAAELIQFIIPGSSITPTAAASAHQRGAGASTHHPHGATAPVPPATRQRREIDAAIQSMEQWASAHEKEHGMIAETIDLARNLFAATIAPQYARAAAQPQDAAAVERSDALDRDVQESTRNEMLPITMSVPGGGGGNGEGNRATFLQADDSVENMPLTPRSSEIAKVMGSGSTVLNDADAQRETAESVMRAAVSCLLLERLCCVFARYHNVLGTVSDMIMQSVFVPDTEEMRTLLNGTVQFPLMQNCPVKYRSLLAPYARKTYFVAHDEVAAHVMQLAKSNRAVEMRLSRQGKIFDVTVKHWVSSIVRNFFMSWRNFTRKRKHIRQQFHAKFARLRMEEIKTRAIRNWRERATAVRRASAMDAGLNEIAQLTQSTESLHEMIVSLTDVNSNLAQRIANQEKERQDLQAAISAKEKLFVELQTRTVEMDRVGSELLDSMLLSEPPPKGNNPTEILVMWAIRMIDDAGGPVDDSPEPLLPLLSEDFTVAVPLSALAAVMIKFNAPHAPTREEVLALHNSATRAPQILVDMYQRVTESPCLVNSDQIASMQRGVLLLFLAGLMRHMTNWVVNKPPIVPLSRRPSGASLGGADAATAVFSSGSPPGRRVSHRGGSGQSDSFDDETAVFAPPNELASQHMKWMDRVKIQQQWIATSMAALHLALEASTQRPMSLTSEEQEDMVTFLDVSVTRIFDILPKGHPEATFVALLKSLQQLFSDLRKVYMTYAIPVMHFIDFLRLAKDCRWIGPNKLAKKDIDNVCRYVYTRHMSSTSNTTAGGGEGSSKTGGGGHGRRKSSQKRGSVFAGDEDDDEDDDDADRYASHPDSSSVSPRAAAASEGGAMSSSTTNAPSTSSTVDISIKVMEPKLFVECVIRCSLLYQQKLNKGKTVELTPTLVANFIMESIVPHALRLDVDRFRQAARHPLVRQVLARHKIPLRRAFKRYATMYDGEAISKLPFHQMAKDCRWLNKVVTPDVLNEVFRRCSSGPDADGAEGLDLGEWQEALCALTTYNDPNPLVPLHMKLPVFVEEKVLSALQL